MAARWKDLVLGPPGGLWGGGEKVSLKDTEGDETNTPSL